MGSSNLKLGLVVTALGLGSLGCGATPSPEGLAENGAAGGVVVPDETGSGGSGGETHFYVLEGETSCGDGGAVSCKQNQYGITFTNDDADWVIYTDCYGPKKRGGENVSVGPGYIARVTLSKATPDGNSEIIDDEQVPGKYNGVLNAPGFGGLGAFGWHHSRGQGSYDFDPNNAWNLDGRHCAEDNGGFGVSGAKVSDGPRVDPDGTGALSIDVFFTDAWTANAPLMRVRYRYRFFHDVVKVWAVVTAQCDQGNCGAGAPGPAYVKEPKFVAGATGGAYKRLVILNDQSKVAANSASGTALCAWRGTNPVKATGQCDADHRARARFDYRDATPTSPDDNGGGCDTTSHPCFNVVMRGYPALPGGDVSTGGPASDWEGSASGLDAWAIAAAGRKPVNTADSASGDAKWSCHGGSPNDAQQRRWELAGGPKNAQGEYQTASFFFHAWEGGTGAYDCEPLSRRFGPAGESFAVHAEYAVNTGWQLE